MYLFQIEVISMQKKAFIKRLRLRTNLIVNMHVGQLTIQQHGNGTNNKTAVRQDGGLKKKRRRIYWRELWRKQNRSNIMYVISVGKNANLLLNIICRSLSYFPVLKVMGNGELCQSRWMFAKSAKMKLQEC